MENGFRYIMPDHLLQESMDENVVQQLIHNYLRLWRNHDFHIRKIESKGEKYEVSAIDKGDVFMDSMFVVDKHTGWVQFNP